MYDFNDAGPQRSFDLITAGTVAALQIAIRRGDAGEGEWLRRAKDGASEGLDLELTVVGGPFARRKFWVRFTLGGTTEGHKEAARISQATLRAILESARGIRPDDRSDAALEARRLANYGDLNGICFVGKIGVEPARNGFGAKNILAQVITPDQPAWHAARNFADAAKAATTVAASGGPPGWAR